MRTNFDLSTGQLSEESRAELALEGAELVAESVGSDWEFGLGLFTVESGLELNIFLRLFFLLELYFPPVATNLLPQSLNPPFRYLSQVSDNLVVKSGPASHWEKKNHGSLVFYSFFSIQVLRLCATLWVMTGLFLPANVMGISEHLHTLRYNIKISKIRKSSKNLILLM